MQSLAGLCFPGKGWFANTYDQVSEAVFCIILERVDILLKDFRHRFRHLKFLLSDLKSECICT